MLSNDTIEATDLYVMVFSDDELKCEVNSNHSECTCSETATHRISFLCSEEPALICQNLANTVVRWMKDPNNECEDCPRLLSKCWKVVAI